MNPTQRLVCPKCGQLNYRKVSGIISEGSSTAEIPVTRKFDAFGEKTAFWYETTRDVKQVSNLAQHLQLPANISPPSLPVELTEKTAKIVRDTIGNSRIGLLGSIGPCIGIASLAMAVIWQSPVYLIGVPIGILLLIPFLYINKQMINHPDKIPPDIAQKIQVKIEAMQNAYLPKFQEYESLHQTYQRAIDRYNRSYYCYVCDGMFDPEDKSGRVVDPKYMTTYLTS